MSDFEKYIEAKYPNRSPKILFQKFKDIDGTLFYGIKEVEDQAEAWNHQQAKINELQKKINNVNEVLSKANIKDDRFSLEFALNEIEELLK